MERTELRAPPKAGPDMKPWPGVETEAGEKEAPPRSQLWTRLRPALPDWRDLHVYGGGLLVAVGVWMAWPPAAPAVLGLLLLYLGLRRR